MIQLDYDKLLPSHNVQKWLQPTEVKTWQKKLWKWTQQEKVVMED